MYAFDNVGDSGQPMIAVSDEDSDVESSRVHLVKNMRTDKVTVHWVSYVDRLQRVLLFTQDERVAKRVRKVRSMSRLLSCRTETITRLPSFCSVSQIYPVIAICF